MTHDPTSSTTPISGNDAGEGWHFEPRRRVLLTGACLLLALVLLLAGVGALREGNVLAFAVVALFAFAIGSIPFGRTRKRLPARPYDGPEGRGLLLPVHPMKLTSMLGFLLIGLLLLLAPVMAVDELPDGAGAGRIVLAVVLSLFAFATGAFFLLAVWGGIRSRATPDKGVLLTPDRVVLRTQAEPMSFAWDDVRAVRPHWNRFRPPGDLIRSAEDPIHNWLSFEVAEGRFEGPNALGAMSGSPHPTLDAEKLAMDPEEVLATCRRFLEHPAERASLADDRHTPSM